MEVLEELQIATALEIAEEADLSIRSVLTSLNRMLDEEVERIKVHVDSHKKFTSARGGFAHIWKIKGIKITEEQIAEYNEPENRSPEIERVLEE